MIKSKWIGAVTALLMAAAVLLTGFAYLNPSAFASVTGSREPAYVAAMDKTKVMSFQIVADEKEWANMLDNATDEEYIPATVVINGKKISNVGIRPKGNSSLSTVAQDDTTDRYSFKIEFDHYVKGQTWLGLDKIVINNMQGDASYMKEYLSYDILSYAGVDTPLYAFADISVNGESWGFYLAIECLEDSYVQRVYGSDHGQLYKPESMGMRGEGRMNEFIEEMQNAGDSTDIEIPQMPSGDESTGGENRQNKWGNRDNMAGGFGGMSTSGVSLQYVDDEISSYSAIFDNAALKATETDYKRVIEALKKLSNGEDLENTVDVEAVLKYFAAHTVVVNLDSYSSNMGHNYYLYEKDGQLTMLPWDYNLAFGGFQSGSASSVVNFPIDTPVSGVSLEDRPIIGKLLEVPEYMKLYHSYLQDIVDGYFNSGTFEQTVDYLNNIIASYVEKDPSAFYSYDAYTTAVVELKKLGLLRAESVEGQLNGTVPSTTAGQSAEPDKLVDASSVNLSSLGSQGGMGNMGGFDRGQDGGGGNGGNMPDMDTMQKAMAIIQEAGDNELTEEQLAKLKELGLTDEMITQFKSMGGGFFGGTRNPGGQSQSGGTNTNGDSQQGGFGGMRPGGDANGGQGGFGNMPQGGGFGGQMPDNIQGGDAAAAGDFPGFGSNQSVLTAGYDMTSWILFGVCVLLLLGGLGFVVFYNRRRHT